MVLSIAEAIDCVRFHGEYIWSILQRALRNGVSMCDFTCSNAEMNAQNLPAR